MRHTYLFSEGVWNAEGTFIDKHQQPYSVTGRINILHKETQWLNYMHIKMFSKQPFQFHLNYVVTPFQTNEVTEWECFNSLIGIFRGKYIIEDDSIINIYRTNKKGNCVVEYYTQIDNAIYDLHGTYLDGEKEIISWKAHFKQIR